MQVWFSLTVFHLYGSSLDLYVDCLWVTFEHFNRCGPQWQLDCSLCLPSLHIVTLVLLMTLCMCKSRNAHASTGSGHGKDTPQLSYFQVQRLLWEMSKSVLHPIPLHHLPTPFLACAETYAWVLWFAGQESVPLLSRMPIVISLAALVALLALGILLIFMFFRSVCASSLLLSLRHAASCFLKECPSGP